MLFPVAACYQVPPGVGSGSSPVVRGPHCTIPRSDSLSLRQVLLLSKAFQVVPLGTKPSSVTNTTYLRKLVQSLSYCWVRPVPCSNASAGGKRKKSKPCCSVGAPSGSLMYALPHCLLCPALIVCWTLSNCVSEVGIKPVSCPHSIIRRTSSIRLALLRSLATLVPCPPVSPLCGRFPSGPAPISSSLRSSCYDPIPVAPRLHWLTTATALASSFRLIT